MVLLVCEFDNPGKILQSKFLPIRGHVPNLWSLIMGICYLV